MSYDLLIFAMFTPHGYQANQVKLKTPDEQRHKRIVLEYDGLVEDRLKMSPDWQFSFLVKFQALKFY